MEYKLSKSEFCRIGFLLAGLFMFLFLFAILNLSSFASSFQSSSVSIAPNESYSETYGLQTYSYDLDDYSIPVTTITTTSSGSGWSRGVSSTVARGSNTIHLVTSEGDFVVNVSQGVADGSDTNHTVTVLGVPQRVYSQFDVYNDTSSVKSVYAVTRVDNISVSDLNLNSCGSLFSDYSSYSVVNSLTNIHFGNSFSSYDPLDFGQPLLFDFPSISTTNLKFTNDTITFSYINTKSILIYLRYDTNAGGANGELTTFNSSFFNSLDSSLTSFSVSDWSMGGYINSLGSTTYLYTLRLDLPYSANYNTVSFTLDSVIAPYTCSACSFAIYEYKGTITDYMDYVKRNWDNISPSVTVTNQNIAQSQSDIGTAQTFETAAFTDFDSSLSNSGLDQFSLSFNSTPLFWCASIINTFYNNMPVGFQYLLTFVAFIGILCTVLNIFGRVAQRFGDRDSSSLNKHDVFSKIEKHGSI